MVDTQLRGRDVVDERVLAAMERVPREFFVPEKLRNRAYDDAALPIGGGQTISQPYMVARICEALTLHGDERVLDAGCGSGLSFMYLQRRYAASFEQVCHRLSTLQRPSARGVPFYFVRVDQAGNITKRHSATRFPASARASRSGAAVQGGLEHGEFIVVCQQRGGPAVHRSCHRWKTTDGGDCE